MSDDEETEEFQNVRQWLTNLGLGYAADNFAMAGILNPRSLSELEISHFKSLGVKKAEDRKKLFFLIRKVHDELSKMDEQQEKNDDYGVGIANENRSNRTGRDSNSLQAGQSRGESSRRETIDNDVYSEDFVSNATPGKISSLNSRMESSQRASVDGGESTRGKARLMGVSHRRNAPKTLETSSTMDTGVGISVDTNPNMEPISPVTMGSPLSIDDTTTDQKSSSKFGFRDSTKARQPHKASYDNNLDGTERPNTRAFIKHQEEKAAQHATKSKLSSSRLKDDDSATANNYHDDFDELDEYLCSDGGRNNPHLSLDNFSRDGRAYKENVGDATRNNSDELDDCLGSYGESLGGLNNQRDIATPKAATASSGKRNQRESFSSRPTVKKTNQSKIRANPADVPPRTLSNNVDRDDLSIISDTSDLSSSLHSFSSLGSSSSSNKRRFGAAKKSRASTGSFASNRYSISGAQGDENRHRNVERRVKASTKSSRNEIKPTIQSRIGKKRLSSIPSTRIAPTSPLAGLSSSQLEESINSKSGGIGVRKTAPTSRRKSFTKKSSNGEEAVSSESINRGLAAREAGIGLNSSFDTTSTNASKNSRTSNKSHTQIEFVGGSSSDLSSRPSSRSSLDGSMRGRSLNISNSNISSSGVSASSSVQRRRKLVSPTRSNRSKSKSPVPPSRAISPRRPVSPFRKHSPSPLRGIDGRSLSPARCVSRAASPYGRQRDRSQSPMGRSCNRSISPLSPGQKRDRNKSPTNSGAVFVHGVQEDNSWATQITQLRDTVEEEHAEIMRDKEAYCEDDEYEMRIRVIVRKRPMAKREATDKGEVDVIHPLDYDDYGRILVYQPKTKVDLTREVETLPFSFDNVFNEHSNNFQIYQRAVQNLIPGVFRGKWASVFAYGQTGSGKTFTMMGSNMTGMKAGNQEENISDANLGLYFLAAQDVFRIAEEPEFEDISIGVSLFEIYGGKLLDLLNRRNAVRCLEDNKGKVCFPGLSEHPVHSPEELMDIIEAGALNRSTGTTSANADSSRSHAVLQLSLRKMVANSKKPPKEHGRLTFIDLAGSERGADTAQASRTVRLEGAEINTSLLALKEVIRALATGSSMKRIPFRGSKLTQVLKESFVGKKSRTVMVACVAPNMKNCDHTLNTLRYADRVKERDPQTGKLTASVAASSKIKRDQDDILRVKLPPRPLTAPAASFRIDPGDLSSDDDDVPPPPSNDEDTLFQSIADEEDLIDDDEEDLFDEKDGKDDEDELFQYLDTNYMENKPCTDENDSLDQALSSRNNSPAVKALASNIPAPLRDNSAAESLISTHRSIMSNMLSTVKLEMELVNTTDACRENIEEYVAKLEKISDQQLSLISTLRTSLATYNNSNQRKRHNALSPVSNDSDIDDSFDLRD